MKSYTLDQAEDLLIGKKGTKRREEYEFELKLELIGLVSNRQSEYVAVSGIEK